MAKMIVIDIEKCIGCGLSRKSNTYLGCAWFRDMLEYY